MEFLCASYGWWRYITITLFFLWMVLVLAAPKKKNSGGASAQNVMLVFLVFWIFYCLTTLTGEQPGVLKLKMMVNIPMIYMPMFLYLYERDQKEKLYKMTRYVFIGIIAVFIGTSMMYLANPGEYMAREINENGYNQSSILFGGGYFYIYAAGILALYLAIKIFDASLPMKTKKWLILAFVICECIIFLSGSTISVIANVLGIMVLLLGCSIKYRKQSQAAKIISWVVLIAIVIIILQNKENLGRLLIDWFGSAGDTVSIRLRQLGEKMLYGNAVGTNGFDDRIVTIKRSITGFLRNPIIGNGYQYGNVLAEGKHYGLGGHSEFFDNFARHGLFGVFCIAYLLLHAFRTIQRLNQDKNLYPLYVTFFIMLIFNPFICIQTNTILFLLIPVMEQAQSEKRLGHG